MVIEKKNIWKWKEENESSFKPPVCNKMAWDDELKIMFVTGPNIRADYHLQETEEFFYQLKGSMKLKVIEKNQFKDIDIHEGQCFLLPPNIPHSPQRFENTLGLVIERKRKDNEFDGLMWFVRDQEKVEKLYERYFHCEDLVKQLPPIINEFFNSKQYKTNEVGPDSFVGERLVQPNNELEIGKIFDLKEMITQNINNNNNNNNNIFINKNNKIIFLSQNNKYQFNPNLFIGNNLNRFRDLCDKLNEIFLLQVSGTTKIIFSKEEKEEKEVKEKEEEEEEEEEVSLNENDMLLIPPKYHFKFNVLDESVLLLFTHSTD